MRKRKGVAQVLIGLLLVAALVLTPIACKAPEAPPVEAPPVAPPVEAPPVEAPPEEVVAPPVEAAPVVEIKPFRGLADVPEIKNKRPIHIPLISGGSADIQIPYLAKFSDKTGVPVTYESMMSFVMYPKLTLELLAGTGSYDTAIVESTWTCEWTPYLWKIEDLAALYDPQGVEGFRADMKGHSPTILRCGSDLEGNIIGLPYYTYQMAMFIRQDVFDDLTEQANFKAKYGYELAPATTWDQLYDQGEFFTRKEGDLLKGEVLEHDTYGLGMQAGRLNANDEIYTRLWSKGGFNARPIRDAEGRLVEFVVTREDKRILAEVIEDYKECQKWQSPATRDTGNWDTIVPLFVAGSIIIQPHMYSSLDQWSWKVEDEIGGTLGIYPTPGKVSQPYPGAFHQAVNKDSKNPEAAFWLSRYLASYECQREMAERAWSSIRTDVYNDILADPEYQTHEAYRTVAQRAAYINDIWDHMEPFIPTYLVFSSDAMGKIYEMHIVLMHEAVTGARPVDNAVAEIVRQQLELQNRFGTVPMREEH